MTTLLVSIVIASLCLVIVWAGWKLQRCETEMRWKVLHEKHLVVDASMLERLKIERVIMVNLGFGKEIWLLKEKDCDIDHATRILQNAVVLKRNQTLPKELEQIKEVISIRFR